MKMRVVGERKSARVAPKEPIVEKLIKIPRDKRNRMMWSSVDNDTLVAYAQTKVNHDDIENKATLAKKDSGLYNALKKRKVIDKVKFPADERAWKRYSDEELVAYAQKLVDGNDVESRSALQKKDGGLHNALRERELIDKVKFPADERAWSKYSDDELVAYAQRYVDKNDVKGRKALNKKDGGLYRAILDRKLLDQVFSKIEAQRKVSENGKAAEQMLAAVMELDAA